MKRIFSISGSLLIVSCLASAQVTPETLFKQLPEIPENICSATSGEMMKFGEKIRSVRATIDQLQADEKEKEAKADAGATVNLSSMQNEATSERLQKLNNEYEQIKSRIDSECSKILEAGILEQETALAPFTDKLNDLREKYNEAGGNGKNTAAIREKLKSVISGRCQTMSSVSTKYTRLQYDFTMKIWPDYVRMNAIQNEIKQIFYSGYTYKVRYGVLLDAVRVYAEKLEKVYEWHPANAMIEELGTDER